MPKTIATIAVAVVGMIIILFLILLFVSIIQQIVSFVDLLWTEITMRM